MIVTIMQPMDLLLPDSQVAYKNGVDLAEYQAAIERLKACGYGKCKPGLLSQEALEQMVSDLWTVFEVDHSVEAP